MARYCDVLLKKTHKGGWSEQEVEDKLNRMVNYFVTHTFILNSYMTQIKFIYC